MGRESWYTAKDKKVERYCPQIGSFSLQKEDISSIAKATLRNVRQRFNDIEI